MSHVIDWYQREILNDGKQPLAFLFVGYVLAFLFIRFSTRMIRAQVKWWPGNVTPGGVHVHHVVFGIVFILVAGAGGFSPIGGDRPWAEIFGAFFGIGAALVLDEFALVLHLRDVYWAEQGRTSVDAVFLAFAVFGLLLTGAAPLGVNDRNPDEGTWGILSVLVIHGGLVALTLIKGKMWTGLLGILLPLLVFVGAIRLARPASPWARWRYRPGSKKRERAERRENRSRARWVSRRNRLQDAIAGRPS